MWALGYLTRLTPGLVPSWIVLGLMVACLVGGGFVAGRFGGGGWKSALPVGALVSLLNLLVLGSLVAGPTPNSLVPSAAFWVPGSIAASALLAALGGALGRRGAQPVQASAGQPRNWTGVFAIVAAVATFFLLIVGGVVTGQGAGLAVVDWPTSYGYNMFLYPLSRMTGSIYYEHAHRLFGSLVGLTTLVLMIHLQLVEKRGWVKGLSIVALVMVVVQGILGGLRVTGRFTSSTSPDAMAPNLPLAVVHGVLAQVFFALMVAIALFTSTAWRRRPAGILRSNASLDRALASALVAFIIVQLLLGALLRHFEKGILVHITMAALVTTLAVLVGARAWGLRPSVDVLERLGPRLIGVVVLQLMLGVGALAVTTMTAGQPEHPAWEVIVTSAHQATGAALLATAVVLMLWTFRLLAPSGGRAR